MIPSPESFNELLSITDIGSQFLLQDTHIYHGQWVKQLNVLELKQSAAKKVLRMASEALT